MKPKDESFHSPPVQNGYRRDYSSLESYTTSQIRVITLRRRGNMPLGFSIRGGWEHGTGIFVSEVQPGSIAQRQGLRVGDQIVRINGFNIHRAIHMEVLSLLKTCPGVVLKVKRVGMIPVKEKKKDPLTWKVVDTGSTVPDSLHEGSHSRTNGSAPENCIIVKIAFTVPGSSSLGCSIAKGPPEMQGIYMCTVKEGGVADQAGLEVGDQILDMNGTSFLEIKLPDAVALMKSTKEIRLTVKKGAGICLFAESYLSGNHMANGQDLKQMENFCPNSKDSLSCRQTTVLTEHDFSGSSSSKSEESSFQSSVSSDSEKDYSISEESGINGLKSTQNGISESSRINGWHKKTASRGSNDSSSSSVDFTRKDDIWLAEERRKLEEEQRRLQEEKERLEAEKRRLELEKMSQTVQSPEESTAKGGFLEELQKVAAKMNIKDDKIDIDQVLLERRISNPYKASTLKPADLGRSKCQEEVLKRRQHEMLMEEFREAHKKMFGHPSNIIADSNDSFSVKENAKQHVVTDTTSLPPQPKSVKSKPPPPPIPSDGKELQKSKSHITVNGQLPSLHSQTLPRPERSQTTRPKTSVDDIEGMKSALPPVTFKITFDNKSQSSSVTDSEVSNVNKTKTSPPLPTKNGATQSSLVEVTPWTTRL